MSKRYLEVDAIRGFALLLMVAFHFCYDLNHFGYIDIDIRHGLDWRYFRYVILTFFLVTVGISLVLANQNKIYIKHVLLRASKLLGASVLITLTTLFTNPNMWIYFGVIHFILVASLVGLLFIRLPKLSLLLGLSIIVLYNLDFIHMHWLYTLLQSPLHLPRHTEDLVQFIPWFAAVLIGIYIGTNHLYDWGLQASRGVNVLVFLGRHALVIYLVHQPILFGIFEAIKWARF